MWIRSQDRKSLSNVNGVLMDTTLDESRCYIYGFVDRGRDILGEYSTQEKALSILDTLEKLALYPVNALYQMPQDDEVGE